MTKKALCVGINDYPYEGGDLRGCVNDANAWASLLKDHYQFPEENIKILLNEKATKAKILAELRALVNGAKSGDVLVYTFAGHGTYIAESGGDEPDYDEAQCAHDEDIVDDELRAIFKDIPDGVHFMIISDSCHSGSVSRGDGDPPVLADNRKERFLSPALRGGNTLTSSVLDKLRKKGKRLRAQANQVRTRYQMKEVLLSGCAAEESSWDARFDDGKYHGAMTYCAMKVIKKKNYDLTYEELHEEVEYKLEDQNFAQSPQLEGPRALRTRKLFS